MVRSESVEFLNALFAPGDTILFRPVETWIDGDKRQARVDYDGIGYHTMGLPLPGGNFAPFPDRTAAFLARASERAASERTNVFFGTCPRFKPADDYATTSYDLAWQIRLVRCLWADIDDTADVDQALTRCTAAGLPVPSIIVSSGNGLHLYWLLDVPVILDPTPPLPAYTEFIDQGEGKKKRRRQYLIDATGKEPEKLYLDVPSNRPPLSTQAQTIQDTLSGIAQAIGGDHTIDLARILRVPGTLNRKNERNGREPVPCTLAKCDATLRYPLVDFAKFEQASPQRSDREKAAKIPLPSKKRTGKKVAARLDSLIYDCVAAEPGARSEADFALCCWAIEEGQEPNELWAKVEGVGKFAEAGRRYFETTWQAAAAHTREKIYRLAKEKAEKKQAAKDAPPTTGTGDDSNEAPDDPHRLARLNLERYAAATGGRTIKLWRDAWYVWKRGAYRKISIGELRAKITRSIKDEFDRLNRLDLDGHDEHDDKAPPATRPVSVQLVAAVIQATSSLATPDTGPVCLQNEIEPNTWLPTRERRSYVSMQNGLLDIRAVLRNQSDYLLSVDPRWFSMVTLGYSFDPEATCPQWWDFLRYNLEDDPERIAVAQEWAGYLLTPSTKYQKFMILEGDGQNGKSVYIAGLTAILGPENVSNVAIENFGGRFHLTETIGKLLNACGDCGEIDKAAEGLMKSFISGDRMFFDRKGIGGMNCAPTARLMLACNNLPRFADRSQGIWRRMLDMPWKKPIEESKRVFGMDTVPWWQESGELPGMFNWALEGLARLQKQRGFTRSSAMDLALAKYKKEMNPARAFLDEACEPAEATGRVFSKELYQLYCKWCKESGHNHPLADMQFGKEVKRSFPQSSRERESIGERQFYYRGIAYQSQFQGELK